METPRLIQGLAGDLTPARTIESWEGVLAKALLTAGTLIVVSTFLIFPYLSEGRWGIRHMLGCLPWLGGAASAALVAYRSSIPGMKYQSQELVALLILLTLSAVLLVQGAIGIFDGEFPLEMNLYRGRCGPMILGVGTIGTALFMVWTRRRAPVRPATTGLWVAVAAGCLASFAIQLICAHENALHVLIWHLLPVVLLAWAGERLGRRFLRW